MYEPSSVYLWLMGFVQRRPDIGSQRKYVEGYFDGDRDTTIGIFYAIFEPCSTDYYYYHTRVCNIHVSYTNDA